MTKPSLAKTLGALTLPVILVASPALAESDSVNKLAKDVAESATQTKQELFDKSAKFQGLFEKAIITGQIAGIDIRCGTVESFPNMDSIKSCLNSQYNAAESNEDLNLREQLNPLRDRWRVLNGQQPLAEQEASNGVLTIPVVEEGKDVIVPVTWPVSVYPDSIEPSMLANREQCNEISTRGEAIACFQASVVAAVHLTDSVKVLHNKAVSTALSNNDISTAQKLNGAVQRIGKFCTEPLSNISGNLKEAFASAKSKIAQCFGGVHKDAYGFDYPDPSKLDLSKFAKGEELYRGMVEVNNSLAGNAAFIATLDR